MQLVIGNKKYSSWSLRPWLLLSAFEVEFEEIQESLLHDGLQQRLGKYSPTARVPVLLDEGVSIWDSLAICETVSERYLDGKGWPQDPVRRAQARSVCCEMHTGFAALRNELPMNCGAVRKVEASSRAIADISRIDSIWSDCTRQNNAFGPWLFGEFSIADCFYAPVALRFQTYEISLSDAAQNYASRLQSHEQLVKWVAAGSAETEIIEEDEAGV